MSYTPATKLSYNNASECATVLTSGMVMVTEGLARGQMMKLEDWLILANGQEQEEYIPLQSEPEAVEPKTHAFAIGTKIKWFLSPETYRVAVQTANGILQVKSVTDGRGEVNHLGPLAQHGHYPLLKTPFESYSAWLKSLPVAVAGAGAEKLIITAYDSRTVAQKRAVLPMGLTDADKVLALQRNFKIRSQIYQEPSANQLKQIYLDRGESMPVARMQKMSAYECDKIRYIYLQRGRNKLTVYCGLRMYDIANHNGQICRSDGQMFNTFAEMAATRVSVFYRNKFLDIPI